MIYDVGGDPPDRTQMDRINNGRLFIDAGIIALHTQPIESVFNGRLYDDPNEGETCETSSSPQSVPESPQP